MNKLLSNVWAVVVLIAVVVASLTTLAVLHLIPATDLAKMLSSFLVGVAVAWKQGTALSPFEAQAVQVATDKVVADAKPAGEEKKAPPIPPVLPLLALPFVLLVFLPAATCAQAKVIARGANDLAAELCAKYYSQKNGVSIDDALKAFCTGEQVLAPWLHLVLSAEKNGVDKSGLTLCEQPPTQSVVDGGTRD